MLKFLVGWKKLNKNIYKYIYTYRQNIQKFTLETNTNQYIDEYKALLKNEITFKTGIHKILIELTLKSKGIKL